jgi:hypothetical protein
MGHDFLEAVLKWKSGHQAEPVRAWLEQHGLSVVPIQAGLLLSGPIDSFARAFHCDVSALPRPAQLPVPAPFRDHVSLIEIPRIRYPMSGPKLY